MKKPDCRLALVICFIISSHLTLAQNTDTTEVETLFGLKGLNTKGYANVQPSFTSLKGSSLFVIKAGGGVILKNTTGIGVEMNAIVASDEIEDIYYESIQDDITAVAQGYYGGLRIEPKIEPKKLFHISFPTVLGGGILLYKTSREYYGGGGANRREIDNDTFFYIEPGLMAEINISKKFRLGFLLSYRFVPNLNLSSTESNAFNTFSFGINLAFGKY